MVSHQLFALRIVVKQTFGLTLYERFLTFLSLPSYTCVIPLSRDGKRVAEIILNERVEAKLECSRRFSFGSPLKDPEQRGFASPRGKERAFC
jgi:hypothetical protein